MTKELESILEPAMTVRPDDAITHVAFLMIKEGKEEAIVMDKEFLGVVTAEDINKRRVNDPSSVKASYFLKKINPISSDTPLLDVINQMLVSDLKTIPVIYKNSIYVVNKTNLLKFIKDDVFAGKKAKDVMYFPFCASTSDNVNTVLSTMKDFSVSKMPLLDEESRIVGLIDSLGMLGAFTERRKAQRGEKDGEKIILDDVSASSLSKNNFLRSGPEDSIKTIANSMIKTGMTTAAVEKDGKFLGMITVKDILKLVGRTMETVYVRVSGLSEEDSFIKMKIDEMINTFLDKMLKILPVNYIAIHVDRYSYKKDGNRMKYSVHGRLVTGKGMFYANDYEWDATKAMKRFIDRLETEVYKKSGKKKIWKRRQRLKR
jgi:predicted transcriptional regulator